LNKNGKERKKRKRILSQFSPLNSYPAIHLQSSAEFEAGLEVVE